MIDIINIAFPTIEDDLMDEALKVFYGLRYPQALKEAFYLRINRLDSTVKIRKKH